MTTDSISDLFTRIRNASLARRKTITVPFNKTNKSIVEILARHGFLQGFEKRDSQTFLCTLKYKKKQKLRIPIIVQLKRLSRPGCRLYVKVQNIPKISRCGKLGVLFLSTSAGILSDREASRLKVGGEILGFVS